MLPALSQPREFIELGLYSVHRSDLWAMLACMVPRSSDESSEDVPTKSYDKQASTNPTACTYLQI